LDVTIGCAILDTRDHAAVDPVLVTISDRLRNATRNYDTIARFGGDEFVILLKEEADESETLTVIITNPRFIA